MKTGRIVYGFGLVCSGVSLAALLLGLPRLLHAERIAIATPSRGLFEFPVVVAMRKGFFKSEGLDVDKIQMQPAIGVKALISGDVDYLLAWGSALRAAVTGVPIKAVVGLASRPLHVLIARPEIKTPKDLKGKVIGVDSVAGTVDYLSRVAVRHFGFEPEKDVKIIVTGESPTRLAALRAGIKTVLIPAENEKDLAEIPENVKRGMTIKPVKGLDEVLKYALTKELKPIEWIETDPDKVPSKSGDAERGVITH